VCGRYRLSRGSSAMPEEMISKAIKNEPVEPGIIADWKAMLAPDGIALFVPQNEGIVTPHDFTGENEFSFALLNS
jgi:hypothetical protein